MMSCPDILNFCNKRILLHTLSILFGFSSWMGANAVFLQVPIIIQDAPEGWKLSSFIVLVVQSGNIGPLFYTIIQKYWPIKDAYLIYFLLALGCIGSLLFGFVYDKRTVLFGHELSLALFIITFMFAIVACTSSVLMMPYMGRFLKQYIITYCMGVGIAGFISSLLALGQGSGSTGECVPSNSTESGLEPVSVPPNFSVRVFFLITFGMYVLSTIAFILLCNIKAFRTEYANVSIQYGNDYTFNDDDNSINSNPETLPMNQERRKIISLSSYQYLMTLAGILSIICNAVLPSIQSFSTLPYGNSTYHYSAIFSLMANPIADIIRLMTPERTVKGITYLVMVIAIPASYIFVIALMSPNPPLKDNIMGSILTVSKIEPF